MNFIHKNRTPVILYSVSPCFIIRTSGLNVIDDFLIIQIVKCYLGTCIKKSSIDDLFIFVRSKQRYARENFMCSAAQTL